MGVLAVGALLVAVIGYIAHDQAGGNPKDGFVETAGTETNPNLGNVIDRLDTGDHYFHPNYSTPDQQLGFLPHRYPYVSGANITAVINHGLDALRRPSPVDDSWRVGAPAEQAW
jgi:hypothetical protein